MDGTFNSKGCHHDTTESVGVYSAYQSHDSYPLNVTLSSPAAKSHHLPPWDESILSFHPAQGQALSYMLKNHNGIPNKCPFEEIGAVHNDFCETVFHSYDEKNEEFQSKPQNTLPFKKRKTPFANPALTKENSVEDSTNHTYSNFPIAVPSNHSMSHNRSQSNCHSTVQPQTAFTYSKSLLCQPYYSGQQEELSPSGSKYLQWNAAEVRKWAVGVLRKSNISEDEVKEVLWKLEGKLGSHLCALSKRDWMGVSEMCGRSLWQSLCATVEKQRNTMVSKEELSLKKLKKPRRRGDQCVGQLWEFLFRMLQSPETNPSVICWEDESKRLFRIVNTEKLAQLWGNHKGKNNMTYANMSRTMRYYREGNGAFVRDDRKRVYGFGPKADFEGLIEKMKKKSTGKLL